MKVWRTDEELFTIIRQELFTCVVGDVMDKMGLQHQFDRHRQQADAETVRFDARGSG